MQDRVPLSPLCLARITALAADLRVAQAAHDAYIQAIADMAGLTGTGAVDPVQMALVSQQPDDPPDQS